MAKQLLSAEEVKEMFNVTDFRNIGKDKLIEFVSAIPYMDKDVAVKAIEQFPAFSSYAQAMVSHLKEISTSIMAENDKSNQAVMEGYMVTLRTLEALAKQEGVSPEDRRYFAELMVDVTDKMSAHDLANKGFLDNLAKYSDVVVLILIAVGGTLLGVNLKGKSIPHLR